VSHFRLLGLQVQGIERVRLHFQRDPLRDLEAIPLQAHDLSRVIGENPYAFQPQVRQDLGSNAVVPEVGVITEGTFASTVSSPFSCSS